MKLTFSAHPAALFLLLAFFLWLPVAAALALPLALVCHEGFHVLAMRLCRVKRCHVEWTPFGGVADVPGFDRLAPWKQAAIALAGPLGSGLAALCLRWLRGPFFAAFANAHLALAFFNCLPLWPLDGARAVLALVKRPGAAKIMLGFSYLLCLALLGLGIGGALLGHVNPSLFLLPPYLAYAARESYLGGFLRGFHQAAQTAPLEGGKAREARVYVCRGTPDALQTVKLINRARDGRYVVLHAMEGERVSRTLTQAELSQILLREEITDFSNPSL